MKQRFFICKHCGNLIAMVKDTGVPVVCCGEKMHELIPGTTDASVEKHVPVYTVEGSTVHVKVGEAEHPMLDEHYIPLIAAVTGDTVTMKFPKPGDKPELRTFSADGEVKAYEICNLHGYWKSAD